MLLIENSIRHLGLGGLPQREQPEDYLTQIGINFKYKIRLQENS